MKKIWLFLSLTFLLGNTAPIQEQELIAPEPSSGIFEKQRVTAKNFMVVAGHPLATKAGYKVLQKGGNAVDAAIAAQMVLNVVEPHASGIGGGGFLLYYDAKRNKTKFFDGRETAPSAIDLTIFQNKDGSPKDFREALKGGASVGTPGALKMLKETHDKYGELPWFELFADAIDVASLGFEVSPRVHNIMQSTPHIKEFKNTSQLYLDKHKEPKEVNETIKNPALADSFRDIAQNGIDSFYSGELGEKIVKAVRGSKINPGSLSLEDLNTYQSKTGDLLCLKYRKHKICSMPMPSSGGVTLLQILGILENFDIAQMDPYSTEAVHVISEAMRLAYADRNKFTADSEFVKVPIKQMLNKSYLKERSFLINVDATLIKVTPGDISLIDGTEYAYHEKIHEPPSTTQISVIDKQGNAVSFTSSIEYSFGSGITVGGFLLNNQLTDFSFVSEKNGVPIANRLEPGKRPRSSMTPTFVFNEDDKLILILGSPGGARIISYVAKTIIGVLDWDIPIDEAVNLPNFTKMNNVLELEENTHLADYKEELETIGHQVTVRDLTSGIHAIHVDRSKRSKELLAGIDQRREGDALGD